MDRKVYLEIENCEPTINNGAYELSAFSALYEIVKHKLPTANYLHIETLWDPESNSRVFNIMFFDDNEESIGGMEVTNQKIIWDDADDI